MAICINIQYIDCFIIKSASVFIESSIFFKWPWWNANHGSFWQDVSFFIFLVYEIHSLMGININGVKTVLNIKDLLDCFIVHLEKGSFKRTHQHCQWRVLSAGALSFWRCQYHQRWLVHLPRPFFTWISASWFIDWLNRVYLTSYRHYFSDITAVSELNHVIIVFNLNIAGSLSKRYNTLYRIDH